MKINLITFGTHGAEQLPIDTSLGVYPYVTAADFNKVLENCEAAAVEAVRMAEFVLSDQRRNVLLNCMGNKKDKEIVQEILKSIKKEQRIATPTDATENKKDKGLAQQLDFNDMTNTESGQLITLVQQLASDIEQEKQIKQAILDKSDHVQKLVEELKDMQSKLASLQQANSELRKTLKETGLAQTLLKLVSEDSADV